MKIEMTKSEKLNLAATILGPIIVLGVIGWVSWSINAKLDLRDGEILKKTTEAEKVEHTFNVDNYVSKELFNYRTDETAKKLEQIGNTLSQVQVDVAQIHGQLGTVNQQNKKN